MTTMTNRERVKRVQNLLDLYAAAVEVLQKACVAPVDSSERWALSIQYNEIRHRIERLREIHYGKLDS